MIAYSKFLPRLASCIAFVSLPATLSGCVLFATPSNDSPGTFSYYSEISFANEDQFCLDSGDSSCDFAVNSGLGQPLASGGWALDNGLTDGYINNTFTTPTQSSTIINDSSNLVFVSSHGGVSNGQSTICLFYCNGNAYGTDVSVNTVAIPSPWGGPAWLMLAACSVTQPNAGWESKFGRNLHGILGFDVNTSAFDPSGLSIIASDILHYTPAIKAWEDGAAADDITQQVGMLVPNANASDEIEQAGGSHYGLSGDVGPAFYQGQPDGSISISSAGQISTNAVYSLIPETVNEGAWLNAYGNPTMTETSPSSNEHEFLSTSARVRHFLGSGGVFAATPATGTAGGVSESQALGYAKSWIASNGGMPNDAVLTFAGHITNPNTNIILPATCRPGYTNSGAAGCGSPTYLQSSIPAYNSIRQWVFIWRHSASGIIHGDKIQVNVDDAGSWTSSCNYITTSALGRRRGRRAHMSQRTVGFGDLSAQFKDT